MAKRRTKKQKESSKNSFTISWNPSNLNVDNKAVKGQSQNTQHRTETKNKNFKNANKSEKGDEFAHVKHELIKTLIFASLILGLEVVLYLASRTSV